MIDYDKLKIVHSLLEKNTLVMFRHFIERNRDDTLRHSYHASILGYDMSDRQFRDLDEAIEFLSVVQK